MSEQVLRIDQLMESELKAIEEKVEQGDPSYEIDRDKGEVRIKDPADVELDNDPREGVDTSQVDMPERVQKILEDRVSGGARSKEPPVQETTPPKDEEKPFEPDPADLRNFIRCMLGNKRFTKQYSFYGGNVRFHLGARSYADEEDCIFKSANLPPVEAMAFLNKSRLAYSLIDLRIGEDVTEYERIKPGQMKTFKPAASEGGDLAEAAASASRAEKSSVQVSALELRIDELEKISHPVMATLVRAMREFDMLTQALIQRADDPKYWMTDSAG